MRCGRQAPLRQRCHATAPVLPSAVLRPGARPLPSDPHSVYVTISTLLVLTDGPDYRPLVARSQRRENYFAAALLG